MYFQNHVVETAEELLEILNLRGSFQLVIPVAAFHSPYNRYFMQDFKVDTAAMVQDAYNHPSVVIYSIGNEIPEAGGVKGVRVGKEIVDAIHALDTTRPTTLCPSVHWLREYLDGTPYLTTDEDEWMRDDPERQKADWMHYASIFRSAVNNLPDNEKGQVYPETYIRMDEDATKNLYPYLDIAGYNYYEDRYEVLHKLHPERVLLGTETRHTMLPDTMKFAKTHPYLIGDFVWTLQSHLGEINCCDLHYEESEEHKSYPWVTNHGGVLDLTGQAEPSLHRYEFIWGGFLDKPVHALYLASQPPVHNGKPPIATSYRWTDTVDGWTYEGYEGKRTFVDAYTDADSVEIFINGKSAGKAQVKDYFAKIPCIYEPGELVGVGYDADGHEIYRTSVRTADAETVLTVKTDKNILRAGGQDFCFADVYVTDKNGTVKLLPDYDVKIEVVGAASLQGYGSAAYKNAEHYDQHHHKSWQGHLQAVLRSTDYFIYSSELSHELCYAVSDSPCRGFVYGGTLVDNADLGLCDTARYFTGNNHGSIEQINGRWYVFYHRHTNSSMFCRQGMVEPIEILPDGRIPQVEITTSGPNGAPLPAVELRELPAYAACNLYMTQPPQVNAEAGQNPFPYITQDGADVMPESESKPEAYICNLTPGTVVGFKYLNFQNVTKVSVKTRGMCYYGGFDVLLTADGEPIGTVSAARGNEWTWQTTELAIPDGISAIYFRMKGYGTLSLAAAKFH